MLMLTIEHETDTAHRLSCHQGKCRNLHGHRYKFVVSVEVRGTIEDGDKFLDFYTFKQKVRSILDSAFDHATLLCNNEDNAKLIALLEATNQRFWTMESEPTVEAMIPEVIRLLDEFAECKVCQLTIYETPTNYCTWIGGQK